MPKQPRFERSAGVGKKPAARPVTRGDLQRKWPHRVALPADKVWGNSEIVCRAAAVSGAPLRTPCAVTISTSSCSALASPRMRRLSRNASAGSA
jgi:hypothetical protein